MAVAIGISTATLQPSTSMSLLKDITAPYSTTEAWLYDRYVAPAAVSFVDDFDLGMSSGSRVLDVGCGGGQILAALSRRYPGVQLSGVDLSPRQAARARRRSGVPVVVGDALDLPFEDGSFDGVLSVASIKHWPDPVRGLAECGRVVKAGGRVFVVEADRGCGFDDASSFVDRTRIPRIFRTLALAAFRTWIAGRSFDRDELISLAGQAGLSDITVERVRGAPALILDARAR